MLAGISVFISYLGDNSHNDVFSLGTAPRLLGDYTGRERERERVSCCQPGPRTLRYSSRSRVQYCTFPLCRPFWVKFNFSRENVQQIFKIYSWYCVADIYSFGYLKYLYLRIQIPTLLQDIKENHREILPPKAELILSTWRNLAPNFLWRYK